MDNFDPLYLFANIVIGSIGSGYFLYGKRQSHLLALFAGIGLIAITFFVSSLPWLCVWAILLMAAPKLLGQYF
jgi:hypothetical protein